ncbi:hypothetical protein ACFY7C_28950 [Streptomyces sp. NPDC012769]|uniref:hypothetical protein n=1 Tax=Streptomyces sp. NPDC012769 TaxID=3364848 RepID=UPI00367E8933
MRLKTAAVASTAALLLTVPVAAAQADPNAPATTQPAAPAAPAADRAAEPVDLAASLVAKPASVAPGGFFDLEVGGKLVSGPVRKLDVTVTLPAGITYAESDSAIDCRPSADGRSFTCPDREPMTSGSLGMPVTLRVDKNVAVGTDLVLTGKVTPVGATDDKPANDTATVTVKTTRTADLGVEWKPSSKTVRPGEDVPVDLVVTNHGPDVVQQAIVSLAMYGEHNVGPKGGDRRCWYDPGSGICESYEDLAPGESVTFTLVWNLPKEAVGTTLRTEASLHVDAARDLVRENNSDDLHLKVVKGSTPTAPSTAKPTAKPTATATASPSSTTAAPQPSHSAQGTGGNLADTGSGPLPALAGTAAALVAAGGVFLVRTRRRARREH